MNQNLTVQEAEDHYQELLRPGHRGEETAGGGGGRDNVQERHPLCRPDQQGRDGPERHRGHPEARRARLRSSE